jgi:glycerol-3-phosphate dehydrogenase (NAD(P)+)
VKNVIAIAAGISDGLGYGANTRCALITRSLAEIMRLGIAMGGRQETFMGLAGLGDLILTCTDNQSRNRRFGLALAQGKDIESAKAEIGQAIEGAVTTAVVSELAKSYQIEMPITEQVNNVLQSRCSPREAVQNLLVREPKAEM